ncbi:MULTISPECIES: ABC transporter substrate-binding protein [unclassified Salinibacterium]|uniref:ABC transporter substrate-binding protein n=1 Tax=unclassified Salinibacterium TaxID=2632331 RepID=UPI00141DF1E4|nr:MULTISPECIES: ABC transporter substrate-binding protein [unclassified Salinibacterium]
MPRTKAMITRAVVPFAAAALLLAGCSTGTASPEPTDDGGDATLRVNFGQFPENWSPGQEMEGGPMRIAYETLLIPGENGPEANLATDWELTADSLTLTLRDDVTFHDGTAFDAEAVKANIELVKGGTTAYAGPLQAIESVDVVDATTVVLNLSSPTPSLPVTLTSRVLPIGSPAAIADGSIATAPVGTSPWAYDDATSIVGTRMVFSEFADYWGEKPGFANIELVSITDPEASAAALVSGEIDVTDTEVDVFPRFEGTSIETLAYPAIRNNLFFFDRGPGGVFEKKELRQAVCTAIDLDQWAKIDGEGQPATQHFVEGDQGYSANIDGYPFDAAAAQKLYAAAGSPSVAVEMVGAPYNSRQIEIYMEQVRAALGNVNVTVTQLPPPQYNGEWNSGKYPLGLSSNDEQTAFEWYSAWFAAGAPGNPSGVESAALKAAADAAIAAGSGDEADALWAKVTETIADEALTCAHARGVEQLAWNSATVSGVAAPAERWEPKSVNYRDLTPAK